MSAVIELDANPFPYDLVFNWVSSFCHNDTWLNSSLHTILLPQDRDYRIIVINTNPPYGYAVLCEVSYCMHMTATITTPSIHNYCAIYRLCIEFKIMDENSDNTSKAQKTPKEKQYPNDQSHLIPKLKPAGIYFGQCLIPVRIKLTNASGTHGLLK